MLWPPTISFELDAEMAEEIDLDCAVMANCRKFKCSVTLTLTLDQVKNRLDRCEEWGIKSIQLLKPDNDK